MKGSEEKITNKVVQFIRRQVNTRKSEGVVIGIRGGIDSAVTVSLAVRALGADEVFGLVLPDSSVTLEIKYKLLELRDTKRQLLTGVPKNKLATGNLLVRLE